MRQSLGVALFSSFAALAVACSAPVEGANEETEEVVGQSQAELKKADPLFGTVCRACGCSMVTRTIDGCQVTRCECNSTKDAECVVNAPGGVAAVVVPPIQPPIWNPPGGDIGVFSP